MLAPIPGSRVTKKTCSAAADGYQFPSKRTVGSPRQPPSLLSYMGEIMIGTIVGLLVVGLVAGFIARSSRDGSR